MSCDSIHDNYRSSWPLRRCVLIGNIGIKLSNLRFWYEHFGDTSRTGFLNLTLGPTDIWGHLILSQGGCPVHCRVCPHQMRGTPASPRCNNQNHLQILPPVLGLEVAYSQLRTMVLECGRKHLALGKRSISKRSPISNLSIKLWKEVEKAKCCIYFVRPQVVMRKWEEWNKLKFFSAWINCPKFSSQYKPQLGGATSHQKAAVVTCGLQSLLLEPDESREWKWWPRPHQPHRWGCQVHFHSKHTSGSQHSLFYPRHGFFFFFFHYLFIYLFISPSPGSRKVILNLYHFLLTDQILK